MINSPPMRQEFARGMTGAITAWYWAPAVCSVQYWELSSCQMSAHLRGSDSAPSLCLDLGLLARGHPDRDLTRVPWENLRENIVWYSPVRGIVTRGVTWPVTAGGGALELLGPPGVRPTTARTERKTEIKMFSPVLWRLLQSLFVYPRPCSFEIDIPGKLCELKSNCSILWYSCRWNCRSITESNLTAALQTDEGKF